MLKRQKGGIWQFSCWPTEVHWLSGESETLDILKIGQSLDFISVQEKVSSKNKQLEATSRLISNMQNFT